MALVSEKEGSHVKVSMGPEDTLWCFRFVLCCSTFFLRSLLIQSKLYLSGVEVNTVLVVKL